ncbi:MAG TPA: class I SAM-dependent methyltransferase [Candidatus Acidoferrum sp.]|jgi:SAM-dependent methyltransferase|nr:class I SAM-dependent methyltransferase [Candidatus Acidoferrum sp.]
MDAYDIFKTMQKQGWAHFAPLEMATMGPAAALVKFAGISSGQRVLDVACGTGVAAIPAARLGAKVTALDLTPELLERARASADLAGVQVEFQEGDVEKLPYADASFDVVISQFGHIFAPRPEVALSEMLRVLKPGGTIAFNTWPPQLFIGQMFALVAKYMPPPPVQAAPPGQWGEKSIVQQRFGNSVRDIQFDSGTMITPSLSPQHFRVFTEKTAGPVIKLVEMYEKSDPAKLAEFRREYAALVTPYFKDNAVRQEFLMTRAVKN